MNTYKNKCNSLYQKDQFFDFLNDECDLEDDVLSEGATVKSINFDCSIQFNMEKSGFKTKRIIRCEKIDLEHTHAIECNEALLNSQSISNSPLFLTKKVEESKSNNSRVKNAPCTSPISLKDEIRQLLRCLVRERNISESKAERKDLEEMPKVENYNWCNLDVDKYSPASLKRSSLDKPRNQSNIADNFYRDSPDEITMSNIRPNCDWDEVFC